MKKITSITAILLLSLSITSCTNFTGRLINEKSRVNDEIVGIFYNKESSELLLASDSRQYIFNGLPAGVISPAISSLELKNIVVEGDIIEADLQFEIDKKTSKNIATKQLDSNCFVRSVKNYSRSFSLKGKIYKQKSDSNQTKKESFKSLTTISYDKSKTSLGLKVKKVVLTPFAVLADVVVAVTSPIWVPIMIKTIGNIIEGGHEELEKVVSHPNNCVQRGK